MPETPGLSVDYGKKSKISFTVWHLALQRKWRPDFSSSEVLSASGHRSGGAVQHGRSEASSATMEGEQVSLGLEG